ncbi:MAG: hypothetical protein AAB520_01765 [Patescibacteria group bacterium]
MSEGEQSIGRGSSEPGTLGQDSDETYYIHIGGPFSLAVKDPEVARQWAVADLVAKIGLPSKFALIGSGGIRSQRSEATPLVHKEQPAQSPGSIDIPQEILQP